MSKTPHDFAEILTPVYKNWMQLDPQFASKNEDIDEKMLTTGKSLANRVKIFIDDARAHLKPNLQFDNLDDLFKMLEEVSSTGAGFSYRSLSEKLYIELDSLINKID